MSPFFPALRRVFLAMSLLVVASGAQAQSGSVKAEVDVKKLGTDDVVNFSIVMDGEAAGLDAPLPSLKNLKVVGGPSTSTQISFVNGSMSRQRVLSFALHPEKAGSAEIGPVSVAGYPPTAPITLDVVAGSIRGGQQPQQDPFGRDPFGGRDPFEEIFGRTQRRQPVNQGKLLVDAVLSRPAARVGEPILVTYFVYTQISLSGVEFADAPKYPGFWAEEIERSRNESTGENVSIQGEPFLRYPVLERLLFPTKSGLLEIPEARLRLVPNGNFGVAAPIERSTKVLRVKVDPLPPGTPEGSAVGSYQVQASADRTTLPVGDALTFRFKVKGRGNLKWVDAAPALVIPGVKIFPPRVTSDLRTTRQGVDGSKTWEFVVVPEKPGSYEIPSIAFSYFNPDAHAMATERTDAIPLIVTDASPSAPTESKGVTGGVSLRGDLDSPHRDLSGVASVLAMISLAAQAYAWRRRSATSAPGAGVSKAAVPAALGVLNDPNLLAGAKERSASRIVEAIESVFGARASWPSDDRGDRLRSLAEDLEFLRFAPQLGSYDAKLREVRDRAMALLESLR